MLKYNYNIIVIYLLTIITSEQLHLSCVSYQYHTLLTGLK